MPRPVLRTPICDLLGIEYPIILAGMGGGNDRGFALAELVAAVSEAGGLGVLGAASLSDEEIHEECAKVRSLTRKPFGIDILLPGGTAEDGSAGAQSQDPSGSLLPEYRRWMDETISHFELQQPGETGGMTASYSRPERQARQVDAIVQEKVKLFAAGLGSPGPYVKRMHEAGIAVLGLVGNVRTAVKVKDDGADIIVAQGHEAGGHTGRIGTFALTPQVVDAVSPTPVVVAGGVGDGRGVAAALALGAQGVWVGTAFLATNEANARAHHKRRLAESSEEDTRITRFFSGKTLRNLNNRLVQQWEASGLRALPMGQQGAIANRVQRAAMASGRDDLLYEPGGQITGLIKEIRPAADVLNDMVREAADILTGLQGQRTTISVEV